MSQEDTQRAAAIPTVHDDRLLRTHLRSQAKRERDEEDAREKRKRDKKKENADFLESVRLLSPFLCTKTELSLQSRLQWAIEWSEHKALSNLPEEFSSIEKRNEIFTYLRSCSKTDAICMYFGVGETAFFKYLKQHRERQQSLQRVSNLEKHVML